MRDEHSARDEDIISAAEALRKPSRAPVAGPPQNRDDLAKARAVAGDTGPALYPLEPFKPQLKRMGWHLTRKQRKELEPVEADRVALVRILSRGYLSDESRQKAAGVLAGRVFNVLGVGR